MLIFLLVAIPIALLTLLLLWSPGRIPPFMDNNGNPIAGSISEKIVVNINGVEQGMFLRSVNTDNPVLLFVHGGPGMPEYFLNEKYPVGLESAFTVCWWEQRGAGLSYSPDFSANDITVDQLVADTIALTDYLAARFGQKMIFLMGHSWGTFIGIQAAARTPEKYAAYIGVAQVSNQRQSERLAYNYMREQYQQTNDKKRCEQLEAYPITTADTDMLLAYYASLVRDDSMHHLGIGTTHTMKSLLTGIVLPLMQCRAYTLREKIHIWRGKAFLGRSTNLRKEMLTTNLMEKVTRLGIPAYFVSGIYDYTVSYALSKQYLQKIEAPQKGFYTFYDSAHSPLFEEPERFMRVLTEDVLHGKIDFADKE